MGRIVAISAAAYPKGIYRPPFDFMYAFVSRTAALTHGDAPVPFAVVTAYVNKILGQINLVSNEESCNIVVFLKHVDDGGKG